MQFQATCQGNTLNIKKTLAELHIKKGDVIDLITIPGSIRSRRQYVNYVPDSSARIAESTSNDYIKETV